MNSGELKQGGDISAQSATKEQVVEALRQVLEAFPECESILGAIPEGHYDTLWSLLLEENDYLKPGIARLQEAIKMDGLNPIDVLDFSDKRWDVIAPIRFQENAEIINFEALADLYRRNYEKRLTVTPAIDLGQDSLEEYVEDRVSQFKSAFELLPHSERFMRLVFELYGALGAEAEGMGKVVITNEKEVR